MSRLARSEASIQRAVVEYAKTLGCICIKQGGGGRFGTAGWPDYLLLTPRGRAFFIEFKSAGKVPTALQRTRMAQLIDHGVYVTVVDDVALGRAIIQSMVTT